MLINRVREDDTQEWQPVDERELGGCTATQGRGHTHEYQTANELFEIMAKNHSLDNTVNNSLSASDLVILYRNVEIGTQLMSEADEFKRRKPNQYIETIVYNDESDGSDGWETYSDYDWKDVVLINKERIDLLSNPPSLENTLTHKFGDLEIQHSQISTQYNKYFLFRDPYIKEQLQSINVSNFNSDLGSTIFPASLLDYICCKRLEDNYNFYMDNVIRYVKHSIEQLKRISNGDYLTEKAKEKWREVESTFKNDSNVTKVLATSASIPLQVLPQANGHTCSRGDIIHSEVDVRSLSKILEKKIIVEVPKFIRGSYKLFSKLCSDNLIVSCNREVIKPTNTNERNESQVDVVLKLNRSACAQVISNISSIVILQANPPIQLDKSTNPSLIPLPYIENSNVADDKKTVNIIEIDDVNDESQINDCEVANINAKKHNTSVSIDQDDNIIDMTFSNNDSLFDTEDSDVALRDLLETRTVPYIQHKETPLNFISPDDLTLSMHKMNMSCVLEENFEEPVPFPIVKKKSNPKVRVKSPYQNKSHQIDEKKRKRLLEIRERREKRKIAMSENSKINKHRYGKGSIMPQASSSVTKLSITNKSFYNSIYGQNTNTFDKSLIKCRAHKEKRERVIDTHLEDEYESIPEKNSKKYINRSYYLDDTVTEIMYTQNSDCSSDVKEIFTASTSLVSNDMGSNLNMLSKIINEPSTNLNIESSCKKFEKFKSDDVNNEESVTRIANSQTVLNVEPKNTTKEFSKGYLRKSKTVEFKKSIEKLYDLMNSMGNVQTNEDKHSKSLCTTNIIEENSTIPCSDSGTSLKHHLTSSNPSSSSFDKMLISEDVFHLKKTINHKATPLTTVVPKVIISTKQQTGKPELDKSKKERKKVTLNPPPKVSDNPLKAISQFLREFDNVQKVKQTKQSVSKASRKLEVSFEDRNIHRPDSSKKRTRSDQLMKDELKTDKNIKVSIQKERKVRSIFPTEPSKLCPPQMSNGQKYMDRITSKKLADIIDEVKEAKGEAVRGPSKFHSRLDTLAQPKKSYVQAHSEEYQNKYGKNLMADRLQRLANTAVTSQNHEKPSSAGLKGKQRRIITDPTSITSGRQSTPSPPPLDRGVKQRQTVSSSLVGSVPPADVSYKQNISIDAHTPETFVDRKHKMVAVASYVKNHYGRMPVTGSGGGQLRTVYQAPVPFVPRDLDLVSVLSSPTEEESTSIGNKLHRIINNMINSKPMALAALTESRESDSMHNNENNYDNEALIDKHCKDCPSSVVSNDHVDIFEDKYIRTAVENFPRDAKHDESIIDDKSETYNTECINETIKQQISEGAFQKRSRIENLRLTPKNSAQQLFLLQSGDVGSILLQSTVSNKIKLSSSHSDNTTNTRSLLTLASPRLDCKLSIIPMQITTVGYSFPMYSTIQQSYIKNKSLHDILKPTNKFVSGDNVEEKSKQSLDSMLKLKVQDIQNAASYDAKQVVVEKYYAEHTNDISVTREEHENGNQSNRTLPDNGNQSNRTLQEMSAVINESVSKVGIDKKENNLGNINCTASLDILVGLLNEIQKITECHISNTENCIDVQKCKQLENSPLKNNSHENYSKDIKCNDSHELVSIASLDKLRQLESSSSIYSLYISNDESESRKNNEIPILFKNVLYRENPTWVDKEVTVEFPERELTTTFTDVPSRMFPVTMTTQSTNISNSLVGILSTPSSTISSILDYKTLYTDSSYSFPEKIVEISQVIMNTERKSALSPKTVAKSFGKNAIRKKQNLKEFRIVSTDSNLNPKSQFLTSYCIEADIDPFFKIKRDILVTVYSMLVLTVFAALSFPEMLYYT